MNRRPCYKPLNKDALRRIFQIKDSDDPESLYVDSSDGYSSSVEDPIVVSSESSDAFDFVRYEKHNVTPNNEENVYQIIDEDVHKVECVTGPDDSSYRMFVDEEGVVHILEKYPEIIEVMSDSEDISPKDSDQPNFEYIEDREISSVDPEAESQGTADPLNMHHQFSKENAMNKKTESTEGMTEAELTSNKDDPRKLEPGKLEVLHETSKEVEKKLEQGSSYVYVYEYGEAGILGDNIEVNHVATESFGQLVQDLVAENPEEGQGPMTVESYKHVQGYQLSEETSDPRVMTGEAADPLALSNDGPKDFIKSETPVHQSDSYECLDQMSLYPSTSTPVNVEQYQHKLFNRCRKVSDIQNPTETGPTTSNQQSRDVCNRHKGFKRSVEVINEEDPDPNIIFRVIIRPRRIADLMPEGAQQPTYGEQHEEPIEISDSDDSLRSSGSITTNQKKLRVIGRFYREILDSDDSDDNEREWANLDNDED